MGMVGRYFLFGGAGCSWGRSLVAAVTQIWVPCLAPLPRDLKQVAQVHILVTLTVRHGLVPLGVSEELECKLHDIRGLFHLWVCLGTKSTKIRTNE